MKDRLSPINFKWEVDALKENKGYILLESLISLAILLLIVSSYLKITIQLQQEDQKRLANLANYRDLYTETRRCRLHAPKATLNNSQIEVSFETGTALNRQGGIVIERK